MRYRVRTNLNSLIPEGAKIRSSQNRFSILAEEGGRMVILVTEWSNREDCLQYHVSKTNRRFIAETQDLLVGSYVVKLFQNKTAKQ